MKRYLRGQNVIFIMVENTDALKEAAELADEIGNGNKSSNSSNAQKVKDSSKSNTEQASQKEVVVVKTKKVVKKVVVAKKSKGTSKSKKEKPKLAYSKTNLVDIAAQVPTENTSSVVVETKRTYVDNSVELKNPLSEDNSKGGLIELLGGLAMVLIGIEIVIIILLVIFALFFK